MKIKIFAVSLILVFALASLAPTTIVTAQTATYQKFGPRANDLIFRVAGSLTNEASDLEQGLIDYMDWAVPSGKLSSWGSNPNIVMEDYSEAGFYEFDLNCMMWPLGHGPMNETTTRTKWGSSAPTSAMEWTFPASWDQGSYWIDYSDQRDVDARWFRRAIAWLTNRDQISSQFPGVTVPMETYIFPVIEGWENPAAPKYSPYSIAKAKEMLDNGGFKDYDGDGSREYNKHVDLRNAWSLGQPAPVDTEEIPIIQLWRRTDDEIRSFAGELLRDGLGAVGVRVKDNAGTYSSVTPHAWDDYDYHIYTGGWGWSTTPDMYYELFHSSKDIYPQTDGDNYNRYHRQAYDTLAEGFKFALTQASAKTSLDAAQVMVHDDVASIPLYTMSGKVAHRKYYGDFPNEQQYKGLEWQGFIDEQGYGYYGTFPGFSSINGHPAGYERGGTIRHGLIDPPAKIDPVDSESFYEAQIISKIYEPLIVGDPTNSANYIPWMCSSFEQGTWDKGGGNIASKVTVTLLPNILWHDNVPLTPADVEFTYWYKRQAMSVMEYTSVKEYDHCEISGNTIQIFFKQPSWLALSWVSGICIIPKHIFEAYPPTLPGDPTVPGSWSFDPVAADKVIGTGPYRAVKDGIVGRLDISAGKDYIHLEANPSYYRELVQPDLATEVGGAVVPGHNGIVDIDDFGQVIGHFGCSKPWPHATWDPVCDVNKDYYVDIDDIMETGARYGQTGYINGFPSYYG